MRIRILHDTIYGNGEKLSVLLAKRLSKDHTVKIGYVCNVAPENIVEESPDLIIFASVIRYREHTRNLKDFFNGYVRLMKKQKKRLPFALVFFTHTRPDKNVMGNARNAIKTLKNAKIIDNVYPGCINVRLDTKKGPLKQETLEKFEGLADSIGTWIAKNQTEHE
jgi:menaquinone-dependent protoporphyrinogen IX oxidase